MLDGRLGTEGIRELVHNPLQHGLADLVRQCLPGGEQLSGTELLRTKYKPGRKLTAYYRLHVGAEVRPIALSWATERPTDSGAADLPHDAPRQLVAPFARLSAQTDGGQLGLLIAPLDPQLPQLMRLNDHSYVAGLLQDLESGSKLRPATTIIQAVRYRPGQRHVLHVSASSDGDRNAVFIKLDRDNHALRAVRFAQAVGPLLAERCPQARLVEPLGYAQGDQAAVYRALTGTMMSQEIRDPARAAAWISLIGQAVRVLHDLDAPITTSVATADQSSAPYLPGTELASSLGAGQHLSALLPELGVRYRRIAMEVLRRLEDLPTEDPRLGHGDLKCDNILAAGDRIWLLDLDRTGLAEPAMDLGKFLADLAWWGHHHSVDVAGPTDAFLEGYGPCDPARISRARVIAVLFRLKLAARRTPVHALDWEGEVTRQVGEAAASLREVTTR